MARARTRHLDTTLWAQFHAYVLGSVIGVRWGKINPTSGMGNTEIYGIVREYLELAVGEDKQEWDKIKVLDAMRYKTAAAIKNAARRAFPSLFPRRKRARPLAVPTELEDENVFFDPKRIETWRERIKQIKQEQTMNEDAILQDDVSPTVSSTESTGSNRVTVNFYIPEGMNPENLTVDNYREVTGKRYRMTKDQKGRGLTRELAFAESKALAVSQLGDK